MITLVWNGCSYQVPVMIVTNAYSKKNHIFNNKMVQNILGEVGDCDTKVGYPFCHFLNMVSLVKTRWKIGCENCYTSVSRTLMGGIMIIEPLIAYQRRSKCLFSFVFTFHPEQFDPKFKNIYINGRECVKLPLYSGEIYARIYRNVINNPHELLAHL